MVPVDATGAMSDTYNIRLREMPVHILCEVVMWVAQSGRTRRLRWEFSPSCVLSISSLINLSPNDAPWLWHEFIPILNACIDRRSLTSNSCITALTQDCACCTRSGEVVCFGQPFGLGGASRSVAKSANKSVQGCFSPHTHAAFTISLNLNKPRQFNCVGCMCMCRRCRRPRTRSRSASRVWIETHKTGSGLIQWRCFQETYIGDLCVREWARMCVLYIWPTMDGAISTLAGVRECIFWDILMHFPPRLFVVRA